MSMLAPPSSGFWLSYNWICQSCTQANKPKSRECRNCGADPDAVVMSIQSLMQGDAQPSGADKHSAYSRGFQIDSQNIVLKMRLDGYYNFPDFMYPNKSTDVKRLFGSTAQKKWFDLRVKWEGWIQRTFGDLILPDDVKVDPVEQAWNCQTCTYENDANTIECVMCGSNKPAAKVKKQEVEAIPEVKIDNVVLDPTVREIRKLCNAMKIPVEKALHFEDLYDKCVVYKDLVPSSSKCAEEALRKLKNLRFDDGLLLLEQGAASVQKFLRKEEASVQGYVLIDDGKYDQGLAPPKPNLSRAHSAEIGVSEMYKWVLKAVTLEHSISGEALSMLADVRKRYEISDVEHYNLLGEIGVTDEMFGQYVARGTAGRLAKKECVVCMEGLSTHVMLDCMHLSVCESCVPLVKADKSCPQCRTKFTGIKRVF
eukprot:TRINITY_DN77786_c0_g1_i1.p1 TRINITY_DN77786_c0_g1~~TRINITY_DN77786_c0_g1_i1.p1  ORF type:complete len:425 (+),score=112.68 TRINITY_DN77786_c0_g1_i1:66-1340(+)